jgi:Zn-dependent protease
MEKLFTFNHYFTWNHYFALTAYKPLDEMTEDWRFWVAVFGAFLLAPVIHEFGHAWMATRLGDDTPKKNGRLTLNPLKHWDALGLAIQFATMFVGPPIGWGKPVPTNPENYRIGARPGRALVAMGGPLMNLAFAFMIAPVLRWMLYGGIITSENLFYVWLFLAQLMVMNLSFFLFNLFPVGPMDAAVALSALKPSEFTRKNHEFGVYIFLLLMISRILPTAVMALLQLLLLLFLKR